MHKGNRDTSNNKGQIHAQDEDISALENIKAEGSGSDMGSVSGVKEQEAHKKPKHKKKHILILEEEYENLKKDSKAKEELEDKLLRLQAEFENARRRMEKEKYEFIKYASEDVIKGFINVIDDFERALNASKNSHDFEVLYKGIEMILKQLEEFLSKKGLTRIETIGHAFDPLLHEALEIVVDDNKAENTIVEDIQKGYLLNGKVLRVAVVKISKKSNEAHPPPNSGG
jgi:molecular chaperone GrpE